MKFVIEVIPKEKYPTSLTSQLEEKGCVDTNAPPKFFHCFVIADDQLSTTPSFIQCPTLNEIEPGSLLRITKMSEPEA
ncbi:hypothetical protein [Xanthomonas sacchari]|uniref:hypothetical protein n=1 Tax=Xanthomonas sacchari TaxID=56458 RepID=UPI0022530481|nr:hypothetical protein [Xanthomonas sacchari]UYK71791.1 hypothetical protein NG828_16410 [Xanthomonas sacchari]